MMWLGRYCQGQWVAIPLDAVDGNGEAVAPSAAPTVTVYDGSFSAIASNKTIAPRDRSVNGSFEREFFLGSTYPAGKYTARVAYSAGGSAYPRLYRFEVVGGGNEDGAFIAQAFYEKPDSPHVVGSQDGGDLVPRRNPKVQ